MTELAAGQTIRLSDGRNAIIRFVGQTAFAPGEWVGVELEDDGGKNDGSVQGERYFDCPMGHGMFVRPTTVTVLAQPPPPQPKPAAGPRKSSRPSSMFTTGSGRAAGASDPGAAKRMSFNAPSPSPAPKTSRPSSIARSPTKSPTKQLTAASSASTSRTGTPSNARAVSTSAKPRQSVAASRTSMGPPPIPSARTARQSSISSTTSRSSTVPSRPLGGRVSAVGGVRAPTRSDAGRRTPAGSQVGADGRPAARGSDKGLGSPRKSSDDDDGILSPQPTSPVQVKTAALERLTGAAPSAASPTTTPRQAAAAGSSRPAGGSSNAASSRENEDLKAKLRVMERKRMEDRDKLKQMDKIQTERDKFESIIQKLQTKYQPQQQEITDLRKALKDAQDKFEAIEAIQAEHESTMELATLDREMAEETAEVLKVELEALRQKSEELELEVEILREENAEFSQGMTNEERASTGWLQMERNNERLREALLRLRDLTQQQEEELRDQIKGLEEDIREFGAVREQYEIAKEKLAQSEVAVEDLRQQLDNALGAEDMIEDLTERNMSQAEQMEELKAVIEDLENLKEVNDELEANHVQNEKELQEELDFRDTVIAEQARRVAQQDESLEDMEYTLSRFRELVTSLQSDLEDMRASHAVTETESEQLNSRSRAMMDLNMKLQLSAAKAQVKTIDLELRRLEAQEAEEHLEMVKLFLPDSYQADRDSVLALLRFRRLAFKANLLNGFLKERASQPPAGHEDDTFAGCDAIDKLTWVTAMCGRFANAMSHCSLEQFARFDGALYELEPVERALNGWIDGLRRDELKEQQCATELQRSIALMSHLGEVHLTDDLQGFADDAHMRSLLMQSRLESAAVAFSTLRNMVQRVIPPSESGEDELAQHFSKRAELVVSQTRGAKVIAGKVVRALEDLKARSLCLATDSADAFEQCEGATEDLASMARTLGLELHKLLHEEGRTEPYTYLEVQACVHKTVETVFGPSESDLFSAYLAKLRTLATQVADLAALSSDLGQTQEFEQGPAPWLLRSQELKALKTVPVDTEEALRHAREELNEARRTVAQRDEGLSTAQLKIDTLEARMRDANAKAERIIDLERQGEAARGQIASLHEDIEKQDRELKTLEADRDKWKKVASDSRLAAGTGPGAEAGAAGAGHERAVATAREMDALRDEITSLQAAVRFLRDDSRRARLAEQPQHEWLAEPLVQHAPPAAERRRALVEAEGKDVLGELLRMAAGAKVYDMAALPKDRMAWRPAKTTPQFLAAKQAEDYAGWKAWHDSVLRKSHAVVAAAASGQRGAHQQTNAAAGAGTRRSRNAAARLQIRLPDADGKMATGLGADVQIVGSREWEGLQGRLAAV